MLREGQRYPLRAERPPEGVGEHQVAVLVQVARNVLLGDLRLAMPLEPFE